MMDVDPDGIVSLNVGGHIYTTSRTTLSQYPDSMLGRMFTTNMSSTKDRDGNTVIDRDGALFRYILNFLRSGQLTLPSDFKELDMLAVEADFYQLRTLTDAIQALQRAERAEQMTEPHKEFLEIIYTSKHQMKIYANADVLNQLTELARLFSKQQQTTWNQQLDLAPYRGMRLNMMNISSYQYPDAKDRSLNRVQLLSEISQLGFVLVGSSKTDTVEKWTFNRTISS